MVLALLAGILAVLDLVSPIVVGAPATTSDSALAPRVAALVLALVFGLSRLRRLPSSLKRPLLAMTSLVPLSLLGTVGVDRLFSTLVLTLTAFAVAAAAPLLAARVELRRTARIAALLAAVLCTSAVVGRATTTYHLFTGATFSPGLMGALALATLNFALTLSLGLWTSIVTFLLGESARSTPESSPGNQRKRRLALLGLIVTAAGFLALGVGYLRLLINQERALLGEDLAVVAELKAAAIGNWRAERIADARTLAHLLRLEGLPSLAGTEPSATAARARLARHLDAVAQNYRYRNVAVLDADFRPILVQPAEPLTLNAELTARVRTAAPGVVLTELYRTPSGAEILDIITPIFSETATAPSGVLLLRIDPHQQLEGLVQRWTSRSRTGECFLFRRDGDQILFLTDVRFHPESALVLRRPLGEQNLLAAQVINQSPAGLLEGIDYRGIPAVGAARRIDDSPWFIMAKLDASEAFAAVRALALRLAAGSFLILVSLGLGFGLLWRSHQHALFTRQTEAERVRAELAERLALMMQHANDGVLLFDEQMRIVEANHRATELYLRPSAELLQLTAPALRPPAQRSSVAAQFAAATASGTLFETIHVRKDGTEFPVEVSARRVELHGRPHVLSIVRDITERKIHEREIDRLNRIYHVISEINQAIAHSTNLSKLSEHVCRILVEFGGFRIAWIAWHNPVSHLLEPLAVAGDELGYVSQLKISADPSVAAGQGPSGLAFHRDQTYVCNDFFSDPATVPWRDAANRSGIKSSIALTLHREGHPAGLLTVYAGDVHFFGAREIALLEESARDVSFAIDVILGEERRRQAELALRQSESRMAFLLSATPVVLYSLRVTDVIVTEFISENVKERLGYPPAAFISDSRFWLAHVHPDDAATAALGFSHLDSQTAISRDYRFRHGDGTYRWVHDHTQIIRDATGRPRELVGYWLDITERKAAEENLRKLSRTIEQAPLSVAITDLNGNLEYVNPYFCSLTGYTAAEVLGQNPRILKSGGTAAEVYADMWTTLSTGRVWRGELHNRKKNGEIYIEAAVIAPVVGESGRVTHYVALKEDITDRQRTAAALQEAQKNYRLIADHTHDVIWLYDLAQERFSYISPSVQKLRGYLPEEILGQKISQVVTPASMAQIAKLLPGQFQALASGNDAACTVIAEIDQYRKDGSIVPTEIVSTLLPDAAGRPGQLLGISRDITERRRARAALEQFNAELENKVAARTLDLANRNREIQALLHAIPDLVMRLRHDGTVLNYQPSRDSSPLAGSLVGSSAHDPAPALTTAALEVGRQALAANTSIAQETLLPSPAGNLTVEVRAAPVGPDEFVAFVRDITIRKNLEAEIAAMLERERQVSEMKTRFISVTSHEFRTPMAAAMGSIELLHNHFDRLTPEKREELFGRVDTAMHRLTEMLDDVLTLSRIDAGRVKLELASLDLARFIPGVIDEVRLGDRDNHRYEFKIEGTGTVFPSDSHLLHHIVSNLLSNGARYSPAGTLITTTLQCTAETARITVVDEGIGIPTEDQVRLFAPFERGSNVGNIKGTGLGLSIVKRKTELLGGTVSLESSVNRGSRFTVEFPRSPITPA